MTVRNNTRKIVNADRQMKVVPIHLGNINEDQHRVLENALTLYRSHTTSPIDKSITDKLLHRLDNSYSKAKTKQSYVI